MASALNYLLLWYWGAITAALGVLVAVLYRILAGHKTLVTGSGTMPRPMGATISVTSPEANLLLEAANEAIGSGDFRAAAKASYEAVEILLKESCLKLGVDPSSESLDELCIRLNSARLTGIECSKVRFLQLVARQNEGEVGEAVSRRCLEVAMEMRDFLVNAPLVAGYPPPETAR